MGKYILRFLPTTAIKGGSGKTFEALDREWAEKLAQQFLDDVQARADKFLGPMKRQIKGELLSHLKTLIGKRPDEQDGK